MTTALPEYEATFAQVVSVLTEQLGRPRRRDRRSRLVNDGRESYYERKASWRRGKAEVEAHMIVSEGTRRIRATLYWRP